jgi:hypothetical protein
VVWGFFNNTENLLVDTKTFLTRVSAALDDVVVCLWKPDPTGNSKTGIFWNRGSFSDFDDATAAIQMWDKDPEWTVYFSVARMANNAYTKPDGKTAYRRVKDCATWFKAICFDLDIGGKYATQREGYAAVAAAVQSMGLPEPMVVSSGRGLHYYWPLDTALDRTNWERVSIGLRVALAEHGVEIDTSKIHDASMVLRPVGTSHKKQVPWKTVGLIEDTPGGIDYHIAELETPLAQWINQAPAKSATKPRQSAVSSAILKNCNLNIPVLGKKCLQLAALLSSGGEFDANGKHVSEPLWRASLGIAAYGVDQEAAMMLLSSKHPDFDHAANMAKMASWTAAPTSCGEFDKHCPGVCGGCAYKGVASPGSLNEEVVAPVATPTATVAASAGLTPANTMPPDYYVSNGAIFKDVEKDTKTVDAAGKPIIVTTLVKTLVCPYEIHVLAMYHDVWGPRAVASTKATATISVKYPMDGVVEHEIPIAAITNGGKDMSTYLGDKQIFISSAATAELTRTYLMNYLARVQSLMPSGVDFGHFGWQEDGSFLCGHTLIGSPTSNLMHRLKDTAKQYSGVIQPFGNRDQWADLTKVVDEPGGEYLGVSLLTACIGALGNVSGAGTPIVSFVSTAGGNGKTLALRFGNSAFMSASDEHLFNPRDTLNNLFHRLGVLGDLSGSMDEYTTIPDPLMAANLAYEISSGREKQRLNKEGVARTPEKWRAPMRLTANRSLLDMFDQAQSQDEPLRMRTLEFTLKNRDFVDAHGRHIHNTLGETYGHAMPAIIEAIIDMGGKELVWKNGFVAYNKKFKELFKSEERFRYNTIILCYIVGMIGRKVGVFRFDIERIVNFMIAEMIASRDYNLAVKQDAVDIIGQFMQEHNHQLIVSRREVGKPEQVQFPVPDVACMRMEVIYDAKNAVLPGSTLAINNTIFKAWLRRTRDSLGRMTTELEEMKALAETNHRVTIYKGCQKQNPGQAFCLILDLTHPRMAAVLSGRPIALTSPAAAVLSTNTGLQHASGAQLMAAISSQQI